MSTLFVSAEKEVTTAISDVRSAYTFVKAAHAIRPALSGIVDWVNVGPHPKKLVTDFVSQNDCNIEVLFNGMMISIASSLEAYLRRLIRDSVAAICKKTTSYNMLQPRFRDLHLISSGYALISLHDPPVESNYDFELICRNLGNCHSKSEVLTLNDGVFHTKISGLTRKSIDEGLDRINIKIDWDSFGRNQDLKRILQATGTRECTRQTVEWLDGFVTKRNKIAHTGIAGYLTQQSELEQTLAIVPHFVSVLADAIEHGIKLSI